MKLLNDCIIVDKLVIDEQIVWKVSVKFEFEFLWIQDEKFSGGLKTLSAGHLPAEVEHI